MKWYYLHKGRPCGPVLQQELHDLVLSKQLGPFDLVYQEGTTKWLRIVDIDKLKVVLSEVDTETEGSQWVTLKKVIESGEPTFRQEGPFTTEKVKKRIYSGDLSYRDYVWKKGMREWYLIASLEEFNKVSPQTWSSPDSDNNATLSSEKALSEMQMKSILDSIETLTFPDMQPEAVPAEVEGPDLTQVKDIDGYLIKNKQRETTKPSNSVAEDSEEDHRNLEGLHALIVTKFQEAQEWVVERGKRKSLLFYFNVILFFIMIGLIVTVIEVRRSKSVIEEMRTSAKSKVSQKTRRRANKKSRKRVKRKPVPEAHFLSVKYVVPNILINTDAHRDKVIRVRVMGNGGEVLADSGIYRLRKKKARSKVTVSLAKMKLPAGKYLVIAEVDHLSRKLRVPYLVKGSQFRKKLGRYKKKISFYHQQEKQQLKPLLRKMKKESERLMGSMKSKATKKNKAKSYKKWLRRYRRTSKNVFSRVSEGKLKYYLYPEYWLEVREVWKQVGWVATEYSKSYDRPREGLERELQKTLSRVGRLEKRVEALSLF